MRCVKLFLIIALLSAASVNSAPVDTAEVVLNSFLREPDGSYQLHFKLSDGQFRDEIGSFKGTGERRYFEIRGQFGFQGTDGKEYKTEYIAGDKGFEAAGKHLPENLPGTVDEPDWPTLGVDVNIDPNLLKSLVG